MLDRLDAADASPLPAPPSPLYSTEGVHDPDGGSGKFFLGREIAHVMGHQGADWLERPSREAEEQTSKMIRLLKIQPGQTVGDIGAGTGYLTRRLAREVGSRGKVYAVDIQPEMLEILDQKLRGESITNVVPILGTLTDPKLPPASLDMILMVDVYHEFSHPFEMTTAMVRALKPGGRLIFVEFRKEEAWIPIKTVHKMSEAQVRKEMSYHPLEWTETLKELPIQHVIVFKRR